MRIGIDASVLCSQWDGIGTYVYEEINYIRQSSSKDEIFLYTYKPLYKKLHLDNRFHGRICNDKNHMVWLLTKLPGLIRRDKLDVFWQPNFLLPYKVGKTRNIVSVDDMSAYAYTDYAPRNTNIAHRLFLKASCKKADKILTISNDGKNDLLSNIEISPSKISVVYLGGKMFPNGLDATEEEKQDYLEKLDISKGQYLLFVGTLSPRKNADVIVDSFIKYKEQGGAKKLVIAGKIASKSEHVKEIINNSKYAEDVILTGYVTEKEKRILYYSAAMLLFPSRLEGFGFPLLEGMQAGIPVITSNCSCMPEIAEDGAVYLNDIDSSDELKDRIFEVENMPENEKRELQNAGYARVAFFQNLNYLEKTYNELTTV